MLWPFLRRETPFWSVGDGGGRETTFTLETTIRMFIDPIKPHSLLPLVIFPSGGKWQKKQLKLPLNFPSYILCLKHTHILLPTCLLLSC